MKSTTIPQCHLGNEFSKFLKAVHKQRTYLVNSGRSQKRPARMRAVLDIIQPYTNYKFTNQGAALFIIKHRAEIRELICERSQVTVSRFNLFVTQAETYLS